MTIFTLISLLVIVLPALGLAWFLARRFGRWRKRKVVLIAALPLPLLAFVVGVGCILYGQFVLKGTCGYDDCGGFILIGILCISTALGTYAVGLVAAVVAALIARRNGRSDDRRPGEAFE